MLLRFRKETLTGLPGKTTRLVLRYRQSSFGTAMFQKQQFKQRKDLHAHPRSLVARLV
jgi:hypothetical protein